jgi:hypothetical protein|tara:strand:- start:2995 stop:3354 length:360 start_codon:yes stop_codon:yes gene_type:complete
MKSLLFPTLFLLSSFISFSQEATVSSYDAMVQSVSNGSISMILPIEVSADDVDRYSAYYTAFFETSYDVSSREVTFNMVNNDAKSRRVILRFLGANKIQNVKVGDKSFLIGDFYDSFLK